MDAYHVGPFVLLAERRTLTFEGKQVGLGPKVVETLLALAERAGETVEKSALLDRIWPEGFVEEANLAQNVYVLRKTFRAYGAASPIATIPGIGYRLTAAVRRTHTPLPRRRASSMRLIASGVAACLVAGILTFGGAQSRARHDDAALLSPAGQRAYVIGRYYWTLRTPESVPRSLSYFARVIDSDPQNPLGYAAMADAEVTMGDYCYGLRRPSVYFARARSYVAKALELDPNSPQAHASLGFLELHSADKAGAQDELRRAIALDPAYAPAHEWYGIALSLRGRYTQSMDELTIASNLDPLSVATTAWLGKTALRVGRFGTAIDYANEALDEVPQRIDAFSTIAQAYRMAGEPKEAADAAARYARLARIAAALKHHPRWAALENAVHLPDVQ